MHHAPCRNGNTHHRRPAFPTRAGDSGRYGNEASRPEPGLQLIDVHNPGETASGILRGAREIPLATFTRWLVGLEQADPVVVDCASGYRSQVAASLLRSKGFQDVPDLLGGYGAWVGAGLPVAQDAAGPESIPTPEVGPAAAKALLDGGVAVSWFRPAWNGARQKTGRRPEVLGRRPSRTGDRVTKRA